MQHYRLNKVTKPGGKVVKRRDTLAADDQRALEVSAGRSGLSDLRGLARGTEDRRHFLNHMALERARSRATSPTALR